ncbi:class I adenylate-forming enzyme family protein [Saccharopolyspora sp. NPDC050389]|uniref:class I adenylate-forming enzyme family protein n=1 Tax=Saccharopolyspora sp. NPDC050389 TaxID=3155516 RepID=UPI0033C9989B
MPGGTIGSRPAFDAATVQRHHRSGAWDATTVADHVRRNAVRNPRGWAFRAPDRSLTWREYDEFSTRLAGAFVELGLPRGAVLGVLLTGGSLVHVVYLAAQKAGAVTLGMGPRAGDQEVARLLDRTSCGWLLTRPEHRGRDAGALRDSVRERGSRVDRHVLADLDEHGLHLRLNGVPAPLPGLERAESLIAGRALGADELFFLNSTSGTTGLSKCVTATMNTRKYFGALATEAAELAPDDVFLSVLPAPYGFGLWSAHFVPAMLGATTVLCADFDAPEAIGLIERERVTVLAAVTSQFIMMLNSPALAAADLTSLRVLFTGGEPVRAEHAAEFEHRAGATVLQFYGSNEAGPLSVTRLADPPGKRLDTVGRPIAGQHIRLFDADGNDVTANGGPGQCAGRGPGITPGYYRDDAANAELFRADGWLLTGDLATIDESGYLTVAGRTADLIIRGGQNISAIEVEAEVAGHPRVAQVAALGVPDPVLGERVCAVVVTRDGADLDVAELRAYLTDRGVSKHCWPERVVLRQELPLGTGGKLDKQRLRAELSQDR